MELHQLRYFVAVAEEGNFSRAAARVHVTQPSLSQQILKLEAEVGQPLFDRLPRGAVLTEAGRRLLGPARRILADLADARRCLDEDQGKTIGHLCVGAIPTLAPYLLPALLREFQHRHPGVTVEVREDVTEQLVRAVEDGVLDLALVSSCRRRPHFQLLPLGREPLLVALPREHPLAGRTRVAWRELRRERFLTLQEMHCLAGQVHQICRAHGLRLTVSGQGAQLGTLLRLVAEGLGVTLAPRLAMAGESSAGCVFRPLAGAPPTREVNLLRNPQRYLSRAARAFSDLARVLGPRLLGDGPGRDTASPNSPGSPRNSQSDSGCAGAPEEDGRAR